MHNSDGKITRSDIKDLLKLSVEIILKYQRSNGAYPACPNFKVYNYCWFRDGSFIADSMSRVGEPESAERFFDWCSQVICDRRELIESGGKLDARYTLDGHDSKGRWGNFQLDGLGIWLWALKTHETRYDLRLTKYDEAIELTSDYLAKNWHTPCNDWWEERLGVHAASLASIYAGMKAIGHPESKEIRAAINPDSERVDASLLACSLFNAVDKDSFLPIAEEIESKLVSKGGGVHRYKEDVFYGGGEWLNLTAMLGMYYVSSGQSEKAEEKLEWIARHAQSNGWMPEQAEDYLLHPKNLQEWEDKWGSNALPLLWSQAMYITLATCLGIKNT